jgi:phage terminase large subunit-like protein
VLQRRDHARPGEDRLERCAPDGARARRQFQARSASRSARTRSRSDHASKFIPLSADHNSLDGLNIHFAGIDEFHAHKTRGVYDVLETATGAREQSLLWMITTSGTNRAGICYEVRTT